MVRSSRIPIRGLIHTVNVLRYADADGGYGGIAKGASTTVYSGRRCRIAKMDEKNKPEGYGNASGREWMILMVLSPDINNDDFLQVAWGMGPNIEQGENFPITITVMTPDDNLVTLTSDEATVPTYTNGDYSIEFDSGWKFLDGVVEVFDLGGANTVNPYTLSGWAAAGDAGGYWKVAQGWGSQEYRVMYHRHQQDDVGGYHHTSLVVELEEVDAI